VHLSAIKISSLDLPRCVISSAELPYRRRRQPVIRGDPRLHVVHEAE